jgi:hypothetical protein
MILIFFVQVLQELNPVFLIVSIPFTQFALILVNWGLIVHVHGFPLVFFLGSIRLRRKILLLLVVLSHIDTINTTIVALDPLLLMDTHSHELLDCSLLIHGVVVDLKGFKFPLQVS